MRRLFLILPLLILGACAAGPTRSDLCDGWEPGQPMTGDMDCADHTTYDRGEKNDQTGRDRQRETPSTEPDRPAPDPEPEPEPESPSPDPEPEPEPESPSTDPDC